MKTNQNKPKIGDKSKDGKSVLVAIEKMTDKHLGPGTGYLWVIIANNKQ